MSYILLLIIVIEMVSILPLVFSFQEAAVLTGGSLFPLLLVGLHGLSILFLLFLLSRDERRKKIGKTGLVLVQLGMIGLSLTKGVYMDWYNGLLWSGFIILMVVWKRGNYVKGY